jgi:hypothetical protein
MSARPMYSVHEVADVLKAGDVMHAEITQYRKALMEIRDGDWAEAPTSIAKAALEEPVVVDYRTSP